MSDRRTGFTLIELLIVVAIIGVLMALLLPAVQMAREAARLSHCKNNLKQIGIGIHQYLDTHAAFPPGNVTLSYGICPGDGIAGVGFPSEDGANWAISILNQLEQSALFNAYDFHDFNEAPQNRVVRNARVTVYTCPSDATTDETLMPASGPACNLALKLTYMPGSYRAVSGRSDGLGFLDSAAFITYPREWRGAIHTIGIKDFSTESLRHVRDGASQTLLIGESTTRSMPSMRTFWAYSYAHYSLSSATPQPRTLLGDYEACTRISGTGNSQPCRRGWGSYHLSGLNFLYCDGSVHALALEIDPKLFANQATIEGEEVP